MEAQRNIVFQNKLKRLRRQLMLSETLLVTHPLVKDKLTILQPILHHVNLQMQWMLTGPTARLLMTFRSALHAQEIEKSQTGFIGSSLQRIEQELTSLMQVSLSSSEKELASLLMAFTQVFTLGTLFMATQLVENWKHLFPEQDPATAKKAGSLLRELGLTFILSSRSVESAFRAVAQGVGLEKKSQTRFVDIGMFFLLAFFILVEESDDAHDEEFIETIKRRMQPTIESVEYALRQVQAKRLIEEKRIGVAVNQLQLMKSTLDSSDAKTLKEVMVNSLDSLGLPYKEVKDDLNRLIKFCSQVNKSFKNIFYKTGMTAKSVIQAA
jgi:hypothetical protein